MATVTLPATELPIPDLDWSIASYKGHQTSDGFAYVASLRRNGKKVANVEQDGRGGTVMVFWATAVQEHREAWDRWVADYQSLHPEDAAYEPRRRNRVADRRVRDRGEAPSRGTPRDARPATRRNHPPLRQLLRTSRSR